MKLADYVINFLADQGVKDAFLVYGAANGDLVDAFTRNDKIRYVCVMHEQAGGFAAEAYSRVSKNFGVAIATSGPGGHNFVTSLGNCYYESVPALFITGQQNTKFMKKTPKIRQNAFQETEMVEIATPVTKYAKMILDPQTIRHELEKAVHVMFSGRPGPVLLDIPMNVQKAEIDPDTLVGFNKPTNTDVASSQEIRNFIRCYLRDLKTAKRPAVMVGGGVKLAKCEEELLNILRFLKIPVFPTWNALDTIASDFEYYGGRIGTYGGAGRNFGIQNSDLLLCLATRVSGRIQGGNPSYFARGAKKYITDIDKEILVTEQHDVKFDEKLCCDINNFLYEFSMLDLGEGGELLPPDFTEWNEQVQEWKTKYKVVQDSYYKQKTPVNPYVFIELLSKKLKKNDIIVTDCGGNVVVTYQTFHTKTGQLFFSNNGNSPMGFSFAAAMGAWFAASPDQNVIGIIGDGGFNMNIQELQTLVNYRVGLKTIILNNNIYGITKAFQKCNYEGRFEACGPKGYNPPDFKKIVEAYGIDYISIDINDGLAINGALDLFLNYPHDKPVVLNVNCFEYHRYVPRIVGWNTPIEDMYPYLPREEFRKNMFIDPVPQWETLTLPSIEI
jgi:acetolactate synthase-1/2/3 large subunit